MDAAGTSCLASLPDWLDYPVSSKHFWRQDKYKRLYVYIHFFPPHLQFSSSGVEARRTPLQQMSYDIFLRFFFYRAFELNAGVKPPACRKK